MKLVYRKHSKKKKKSKTTKEDDQKIVKICLEITLNAWEINI